MPALFGAALILGLLYVPGLVGVKPVYLWTDRLLFLLVIMAGFLVAYIRRKEHLRGPWMQVLRRPMAMGAMVVLSAYVLVGVLDSIHFRQSLPEVSAETETHYSSEVLSVLDTLMTPLRIQTEKSYSAPFATHAYVKEMVVGPAGDERRVFPRLEFGGAHLGDEVGRRSMDILKHFTIGLLEGLAVWVVLAGAVVVLLARHSRQSAAAVLGSIASGRTQIPWRTMLYTLLVVFVLIALIAELGPLYHILGTDKVGQDVLYHAIKSIRTGLAIGTLTTLVMLPFAILLGIAAGYFKGWVDDVIQYTYTTLSSIPGVLLIAAAILSIQVYMANHPELFETGADRADLRLLALCIILGITSWTSLCRLLRGETFKLGEMDYIQAATAFGVGHATIIGRHILPNVLHIVLIIVVLDFSSLVLAEAVLSYVGVGVDPSTISWGNMINSARLEMAREPMVWWSLAAAFVFMFALVLSANLFSDAVRDAFDPRLREAG